MCAVICDKGRKKRREEKSGKEKGKETEAEIE